MYKPSVLSFSICLLNSELYNIITPVKRCNIIYSLSNFGNALRYLVSFKNSLAFVIFVKSFAIRFVAFLANGLFKCLKDFCITSTSLGSTFRLKSIVKMKRKRNRIKPPSLSGYCTLVKGAYIDG